MQERCLRTLQLNVKITDATNAEKLRRSSLALRGKRCYHLFLCCVAPTAPAVQPAVPLAVYGCGRLRSWARLHVRLSRFACMMRLLSPAIVRKTRGRDCGQRLSRKGARPLSSALPHGSLGDRSDDPRRTKGGQRENIDVHGRLHQPLWWAAPSDINDALLAARAAEER